MRYELKIESPRVNETALNFYSDSLSPGDDFVISYNRGGSVLSLYGDWTWNLSPYAGVRCRISFAKECNVGETLELQSQNVACYKRIAFYFLYGPRDGISARTVVSICDAIGRVIRHCNANGIRVEKLGRFDRVVDTLASNFAPTAARLLPRLLLELWSARRDIGFELVNCVQIGRIKQQLPYADIKQTAYIPRRICDYQLWRCKQMLQDYCKHRNQWELLFQQCLEAYSKTYGSVALACESKDLNGRRNPFSASQPSFCGTTFIELAKRMGVADVMERWVVSRDVALGESSISIFGKYFSAVQFVGRIYLLNYSGMRIQEGSQLRASCLVRDTDPVLGDVYMLRGETSKTIDDDNALWISSKETELAVEAMSSVARMRIGVAAHITKVPLTQRDIDDPRLVTRAYEPWSTHVGRESDPDQRVHAPYMTWRWRCPRLFDPDELKISAADFEEAVRMTPSLDSQKFAIGREWPLAYHQLRRTLNCNAAGSGIVSPKSLQYQMKHQLEAMTQYYGRNYSSVHLNQSMQNEYAEAVIDALVSKAFQILGDDFVSPFGPDHKQRKTELISREGLKGLRAKAKKGRLHFRENALGVCMFAGYCPLGGMDNIVGCIKCDELLVDRRKRERFVRLADEIALELAVVSDKNNLQRDSLTAQHDAMRNVIDVILA